VCEGLGFATKTINGDKDHLKPISKRARVKLEDERAKADHIMKLLMGYDEVRVLLAKKISELVISQTLPTS
jgi:hypothetical protein